MDLILYSPATQTKTKPDRGFKRLGRPPGERLFSGLLDNIVSPLG